MVYEGLLVKKVALLTIEGFNFYFLRQKLSLLNWSVIKVTGRPENDFSGGVLQAVKGGELDGVYGNKGRR